MFILSNSNIMLLQQPVLFVESAAASGNRQSCAAAQMTI